MKTKTILFFSIFLLLLVIGAVFYFYPKEVPTAISQCTRTEEGISFNEYLCPENAASCEATVILDCNKVVLQPVVIYRATDESSFPEQIAADVLQTGNMQSWKKVQSSSVSQSLCGGTHVIEGFSSWGIERNNELIMCTFSDNNKYTRAGATIPTSSSSVAGYSELTEGEDDIYQCTEIATVGTRTYEVTYSGKDQDTKEQAIYLASGETISWQGEIRYRENILLQSACDADIQDPNNIHAYYTCIFDSDGCGVLSGSSTLCTPSDYVFDEDSQECEIPYSLIIDLDKTLYGTNEQITGIIRIEDTDIKSATVRLTLLSPSDDTIQSKTIITNANGIAQFSMQSQSSIGDYKVKAETESYPLGDISKVKIIQIRNPIFLRLSFPTGFSPIQYNSNPITVKATVTDANGNGRNVRSTNGWDFAGTRCGESDFSTQIITNKIKTGEYELTANVNRECLFDYKVIAIDSEGFRSNMAIQSIEVRESEIQIIPDLTSIQDQNEGRYTITFTTLDANNQPISTDNDVRILDSDGCTTGQFCLIDNKFIPEIVVSGQDGFYSFTHDFKDGLNVITVSTSSIGLSSTSDDFIVNLFPTGQGGGGGGEDFPLGLVITGIIVFIVLALFFWIVFRKKKNA